MTPAIDMPGSETVDVADLHESEKIDFGLAVINRKDRIEPLSAKSKDGNIFFRGTFEFFGIDFEVLGIGDDDQAWMSASFFGNEVVQSQCKAVKILPLPVAKGSGMVIYVSGIVIDTCLAIANFFKDKIIVFKVKKVDRCECLDMPGFPPFVKLVVKKMESNPLLVNEILQAAIDDVVLSRLNVHG